VAGWEEWRDYDLTFLEGANRFELGCGNLIGQVGLLEAVRYLIGIGIERIERWTLHLTDLLIQELEASGYAVASNLAPERRSAIVSFRIPGGPESAYERLTAADIIVSKREDLLRVSPHCYNTEEEIGRVCDALGCL
jgi:selenocysteine lyase/cysteine desulfurase